MKSAYGVAAAFLVCGCTTVVRVPAFRHPEFTVPCEVAVLPVINRTRDVRAAAAVRELMCDVLASRGYRVLPPDWVDARLAEAGYADVELALLAPREDLAEALTAAVFVVGTLRSCDRTPVGLVEKRTVRLSAEVTRGTTTYWRGSLEATRYGVRAAAAGGVPGRTARSRRGPVRRVRTIAAGDAAQRHPLQAELTAAVSALLADIPGTGAETVAW